MNRVKRILSSAVLMGIAVLVSASEPVEVISWGKLLQEKEVTGSVLVYSVNSNQFVGCNLDQCNTYISPASTFKIPNTLIGLETGVISSSEVIPWNGISCPLSAWETDMNISQAFKVSCVPFYQEIARRVGVERMNYYVRLFHFGKADIKASNIDVFWLTDDCQITQFQQIYFLKQVISHEFPLRDETYSQLRDVMLFDNTELGALYAKSGMTNRNSAWFVGYLKTADDTLIFATHISLLSSSDKSKLIDARESISRTILKDVTLQPSLFFQK